MSNWVCTHGMETFGVCDLCWHERIAAAEKRAEDAEELQRVVKEVHAARGDDNCWMDIDLIFKAAGLPVPDRTVGDKGAMLSNCRRFILSMCSGGEWRTYVELEEALTASQALAQRLATELRRVLDLTGCEPVDWPLAFRALKDAALAEAPPPQEPKCNCGARRVSISAGEYFVTHEKGCAAQVAPEPEAAER